MDDVQEKSAAYVAALDIFVVFLLMSQHVNLQTELNLVFFSKHDVAMKFSVRQL